MPDSLRDTLEINKEWMEAHGDIVWGHGITPEGQEYNELREEYERRLDENRRIRKYLGIEKPDRKGLTV